MSLMFIVHVIFACCKIRLDTFTGNLVCDAVLESHMTGPSAAGEPWTDVSLVMLNGGGIRTIKTQGRCVHHGAYAVRCATDTFLYCSNFCYRCILQILYYCIFKQLMVKILER